MHQIARVYWLVWNKIWKITSFFRQREYLLYFVYHAFSCTTDHKATWMENPHSKWKRKVQKPFGGLCCRQPNESWSFVGIVLSHVRMMGTWSIVKLSSLWRYGTYLSYCSCPYAILYDIVVFMQRYCLVGNLLSWCVSADMARSVRVPLQLVIVLVGN